MKIYKKLSETLAIINENVENGEIIGELIETLRNSEISTDLEKLFESKLQHETLSESSEYVLLEGKYSILRAENTKLKEEKLKQKEEFDKQLEDTKTMYETKLRHIKIELDKANEKFGLREKEFYEELQLAQTRSVYEFDQIEKKLKWQLSEANKKLHETDLINSRLRSQIIQMENELKFASFSRKNHVDETNFNKNNRNCEGDVYGETTSVDGPEKNVKTDQKTFPRVYESLQIKCKVNTSAMSSNDVMTVPERNVTKAAPLFKGKKVTKARNVSKNGLPPLIPCSDVVSVPNRKRRLHDPEDLSYLDYVKEKE